MTAQESAGEPLSGRNRTEQPVSRDRWRKVVAKAYMNNTTKVLLLAIGNQMDRDGRCQVSNDTICQMLGWTHDRSVSRHLRSAFQARYLVRVDGGHRGFTSVYQATLPAFERAPISPPTDRRLSAVPPPPIDELCTRSTVADRSPSDGDPKRESERSEHGAGHEGAWGAAMPTSDKRDEADHSDVVRPASAPAVRVRPQIVIDAYRSYGDTPP